MLQVDLIRGYTINRCLRQLKIYISTLPEREEAALESLTGEIGAKNVGEIADFVLAKLGHKNGKPSDPRFSESRRAANKAGI